MNESTFVQPWKASDLGQIPEDWDVDTVANLGGKVTSGSRGWAEFYSEHGNLFVRITNLRRSNIHLDLSSSRYVSLPADNSEARRTRLQVGDLLISITADIGIIGYIDESVPSPAYINQHIARVRFSRGPVSNKFVAYYLSSWHPQRIFIGSTDTGAKAGMNLTTVGGIRTVIPPLAEQKRIATALSDADKLIAALDRLITKKQAIKQGLMQQLLTGETRLPGFIEPWKMVTFEQLAVPTHERTDPRAVPASTRLIELEHIESAGGRLLISSTAQHAVSLKTVFQPGDVLFGKLRAYLRKYWLADSSGICSTEIWALRARPAIDGAYVRYLVETDRFIEAASGGYGTHMPRSDWSILRRLEFETPSLNEQRAIASVLRDADDELSMLRSRLTKAKAVKQGMVQQLLTGRVRLPGAEVTI